MSPANLPAQEDSAELALELCSRRPRETRDIGLKIAQQLQPGDVILLVGQLGAGKTCLTQGIAHGLGINDYVMSPSFVLLREHHGRLPLYHVDFYRLERTAEICDLGLDDYFYGKGISVIEWADRAMPLLPPDHLLIELQIISPNKRRVLIGAEGERSSRLLEDIRKALQ